MENKIYTEKHVNYDKIHRKLPFCLRYYGKIHSELPIFRVKSVKIYTSQKKIYTSMLVALVTNIRHGTNQSTNLCMPQSSRPLSLLRQSEPSSSRGQPPFFPRFPPKDKSFIKAKNLENKIATTPKKRHF